MSTAKNRKQPGQRKRVGSGEEIAMKAISLQDFDDKQTNKQQSSSDWKLKLAPIVVTAGTQWDEDD